MATQRRRFLVVHNNERESGAIVSLFESLGQKVSATWSGRDALDCLAAERFDLLLVDGYVADMYVGDLIERVLRMANHPRVAIMKTGGKSKTIRYDKSLGECRFVEKGQSDQMPQALRAAFPDFCNAPLN
jgi:CheY-like chemotaxis protein